MIKSRCLSNIISQWDNQWRVTGITINALKIFAEHDFKRKSRMGINRAHISQDRLITNMYLLDNDLSPEEFWKYLYENDNTVLATSSENKKNVFSEIIKINESQDMFNAKGFAWKHNKKEIDFLAQLYNKHLN